jgi:glycosyltransferase involved in cell wall biosynthesis
VDLLINEVAVARSSLGVKRYYARVMEHLAWPGCVERIPPWQWRRLERPRELLQRGRPNAVFWTPCQRGPLFAHNHVVTVHDCINVEFTYRHDWRLPSYKLLFGAILNQARSVVAISNATKSAILRNYGVAEAKVLVIQSGYDVMRCSAPHESQAEESAAAATEPYVLMFSNMLPHKNAIAACRAYAASRARSARIALRVVGGLPPEAQRVCHDARVRLHQHAHATDAELAAWYRGCLFLLSPSLDEGHDLPIAEALAYDVNVLCSDIDSHREFYEGDVAFFDPRSIAAMTAALDAAFDRPGRWPRRDAVARSRSFEDVAADYRRLFQSVGRNG